MPTQYVAGVCNINKAEIRSRRNVGHIGLAVSLVLVAFLFVERHYVSPWLGLATALSFWISATGYLQAKNKFCVGHGLAGTQIADDGMSTFARVKNPSDAATDRRRAQVINAQAMGLGLLAGILVTAVLFLLG